MPDEPFDLSRLHHISSPVHLNAESVVDLERYIELEMAAEIALGNVDAFVDAHPNLGVLVAAIRHRSGWRLAYRAVMVEPPGEG